MSCERCKNLIDGVFCVKKAHKVVSLDESITCLFFEKKIDLSEGKVSLNE